MHGCKFWMHTHAHRFLYRLVQHTIWKFHIMSYHTEALSGSFKYVFLFSFTGADAC